MSTFPGGEGPLMGEGPRSQQRALDLYAHAENLCVEETELQQLAEHERTAEQHERLHAIEAELDRTWEHLRERAHRRGRHSG